jgi:hypothetical protein
MRKRFSWLFLCVVLLLAPTKVLAQGYEVPPVDFTGPLSHPRYEGGGFFTYLEALYMHENRPIQAQQVAVRGFVDVDGSISGKEGTFVGSGAEALNTNQLNGSGSWQPGLNLGVGWRFESGTVLTLNWYHLVDSRYSATASLAPPGLQGGAGLADTFLFSPVFNFPINYAGNAFNLSPKISNPGATFGIWNAASLETISYVQRFDMVDLTMRVPLWQTDCYRGYALVGPRGATLYDQFKWRTVDADFQGFSNNGTIADYRNTTSNRLYGAGIGFGNELYLGDTPVGAFSISAEALASLYMDFIKGRASYELADRSTVASRARNLASVAPSVDGRISVHWFPWEAIEIQVGYDVFAFFNTYASPQPIDFNYGAIDPNWSPVTRLLHGVRFGIGVVF